MISSQNLDFLKKIFFLNYKLKQTDPKEYSNGNPYH